MFSLGIILTLVVMVFIVLLSYELEWHSEYEHLFNSWRRTILAMRRLSKLVLAIILLQFFVLILLRKFEFLQNSFYEFERIKPDIGDSFQNIIPTITILTLLAVVVFWKDSPLTSGIAEKLMAFWRYSKALSTALLLFVSVSIFPHGNDNTSNEMSEPKEIAVLISEEKLGGSTSKIGKIKEDERPDYWLEQNERKRCESEALRNEYDDQKLRDLKCSIEQRSRALSSKSIYTFIVFEVLSDLHATLDLDDMHRVDGKYSDSTVKYRLSKAFKEYPTFDKSTSKTIETIQEAKTKLAQFDHYDNGLDQKLISAGCEPKTKYSNIDYITELSSTLIASDYYWGKVPLVSTMIEEFSENITRTELSISLTHSDFISNRLKIIKSYKPRILNGMLPVFHHKSSELTSRYIAEAKVDKKLIKENQIMKERIELLKRVKEMKIPRVR